MVGRTFTVERRTRIDAPPPVVLERIADFRRWPAWSPWEAIDPDMRRTHSGAPAGVGSVYEWSGNRKAGAGRMEITEADAEHVAIDLRFDKPFKAHNTTTFAVCPVDGGSEVTWTMVGPMTFLTRVMGVFRSMDQMVGPDFEKGLAALKADAERT